MRWFWPSGLTGRVALVLILALITVQLLSLPFYLRQQTSEATELYQHSTLQRINHIVKLFEQLNATQRRDLLPALNSPSLSMDAYYQLTQAESKATDEPSLAATLSTQLDRNVIVKHAKQDGSMLLDMFPSQQRIAIWVPLKDNSWLRFSTSSSLPSSGWIMHISAQIIMLCIAVIILAIVAARQLTRPIRTFAAAAERLGTDVNAEPIEEKGSTELRKATRAFNTMQQRLQSYVEDRTKMLAAISHDLRTSLTRLRLRTEFIEDEQQQRKAEHDLEDMEAMLASTLTFARDDAGQEKLVNLDLAKLIHTLCDDMEDLEKDVIYQGPEALTCLGRPTALKRAISNVIINAVNYGKKAKVTLSQDEENINIQVEDDGPGIPAEQIEKVFEPFVRLDQARNRSTGGTGLGLSITRSVIRSHGGDVTLKNHHKSGLVVTLALPKVS
ncbi:ATP-binding protein [Thalassotalea psychrophila]|uniref:histidine kinase n=1 Tax=Thalassotalea psychrophila TaxID=3065647 RepID=A0ABY9TTR2_9GAMM|nr:ATP-binding protein [Colwelliaceae bacterium SQ149]